MADRLHNMRTLGSMAPNKQYKIAGETLYIYAPLAHRLGLFEIKTELEDLSFKYEHPAEYERISDLISKSEARRTAVYQDTVECPYSFLERVKLACAAHGGMVGEIEYAANVTVHALLPEGSAEAFQTQMTELSAGNFSAVELGEVFRAVPVNG